MGEGGFKGVVVFPVGKVGDEILAHFHRQILAGVGIKTSPVAQDFKIGQPDGKQLAAFFLFLRLAGLSHRKYIHRHGFDRAARAMNHPTDSLRRLS